MASQRLIGLTGGIGSGKSAVAAELRKLGIPVYDSDTEARRIINTDAAVRAELCALFGSEVYADGQLDRPRVAQIVFRNPELLRRMNAIVHPRVRADVAAWAGRQPDAPLLFVESAILYQSGFDSLCDRVVWVTAPESLRVERVVRRDGLPEADVRLRMSRQGNESDLIRRADLVLHNDGLRSLPELAAQAVKEMGK